MKYHKWILSREEIDKKFKEKNLKIAPEIIDPEGSLLLKEKLSEIYKFLIINFEEDLKEGMETRVIRNALYKYANHIFFEETDGVEEMIQLLGKRKVLELYEDDIITGFAKIPKKKEEKK